MHINFVKIEIKTKVVLIVALILVRYVFNIQNSWLIQSGVLANTARFAVQQIDPPQVDL